MFLFVIVFVIGLAILNPVLPVTIKAHLYSTSLAIKSILMTCLPFVIMGLLYQAAIKMAKSATKMIIMIFCAVCVSNFVSTWVSFCVGNLVFNFDLSVKELQAPNALKPVWHLNLFSFIENNHAMFLGLFLGWFASFFRAFDKTTYYVERFTSGFLKYFQYLLPVFIGGFFIKMMHDGIVLSLLKNYFLILICILLSQLSWVLFLYMIGTQFKISFCLGKIKNMIPAAFAGFSTMSSASAMPFTLIAIEKNTNRSEFAQSLIPATVNIHLIGDCFAIPIFAFAILKTYGLTCPSFLDYLYFSFYFVIAKFSVAAIPGGGIIVMLPILEKYLGFSNPMLSLITALYILFDPFITSINIFGNGAFAIILNRIYKKLYKK